MVTGAKIDFNINALHNGIANQGAVYEDVSIVQEGKTI